MDNTPATPVSEAPPARLATVGGGSVTQMQAIGFAVAIITFGITYLITPISAIRDDVRTHTQILATYPDLVKRVDSHDTQLAQIATAKVQTTAQLQALEDKSGRQDVQINQLQTTLASILATVNDIRERIAELTPRRP